MFFIDTTGVCDSAALRALADANNKQYQELKKLGAHPTPGAIDAINHRFFDGPLRALAEEHHSTFGRWKTAIANQAMRAKLKLQGLLGSKSAPSELPPASDPQPQRRPARAVDTTTGRVGDVTGAQRFQLQNQPHPADPAPRVIDGIIQER